MTERYDMVKLLKDHGVPCATSGRHAVSGWVQVHCPFCDDQAKAQERWHLGYDLKEPHWHCWKCGWHDMEETLSELLGISEDEVYRRLKGYRLRPADEAREEEPEQPRPAQVALPYGTGSMGPAHHNYLIGRKFDPVRLAQLYGLQGTGHLGPYKFRIVAPIWHQGILVSYQCRDITGRSSLPYKACPQTQELIDHKHTLYANWLVDPDRPIVVVEGIMDAFRLGPGAVATYGTSWTPEQASLIGKHKNRVFILYDPEPEAQGKARRLAHAVNAWHGETVLLDSETTDPGDMAQDDADHLMRELGIR